MHVLVVTNAYPTVDDPAAGIFVERQVESVRAAGATVEVLVVDRSGAGPRAYAGLSRQVARAVRTYEAELVHVTYGGVMAAAVAARVRSRPVLVSFCGTDLLGSPGEPLARRATIHAGVLASRLAARRAAGVVVKSPALREALPRSVRSKRVWIVPSGIDLDRFRPLDRVACRVRLGWTETRRHVLFPAARTRAEKRYPLARAAVAELHRHDVELHALDAVPPDEVSTWLNAADAVLLTSTHEGSPNAIKEALACEVPIVSVDVGDVRELVAGIDGCYVTAADAAALAEGLAKVLRGPGRVDSRRRVADLSLTRTASRLVEIYAELIARAAGGG